MKTFFKRFIPRKIIVKTKLGKKILIDKLKLQIPPCLLALLSYLWLFFVLMVYIEYAWLHHPYIAEEPAELFLFLATLLLLGGLIVIFFFNRILFLNLYAIFSTFLFCFLEYLLSTVPVPVFSFSPISITGICLFIAYIIFAVIFFVKRQNDKDAIFNAKMKYITALNLLLEKNLITEDEEQTLKTAILDEAFLLNVDDKFIAKMEHLKKLHDNGTLADEEYRIEKAKVLDFIFPEVQTEEEIQTQDSCSSV